MSAFKEKVRKITKKTLKFLGWTTGILVVLQVSAYFAFRSPAVQTWIAQKVGNYLADELDTKITIGGVDIKFFTSIELEELYVEDQHGDTLLDAESFVVNLSQFDYDAQHVRVDNITLTNANIKVKKYEGEKGLNFRFFVKYFESSDTTRDTTSTPWDVEIGTVKLENCRFAFIDTRWTDEDRGMDYENIQVRDIFLTLERIEPMGDSTSVFMSELRAKERSGFQVDHMESRLMLADTFIKFNDLIVQTPGSDVKGWIGFHFNSFDDVEDDFIHKVKMDGHFSESVVEMGDIAYFSPVLLGIQKKVLLTADVVGTAEKLKTKNVDLRFGKSSRIAGNFAFDGLPDIENTDMHFKFKESTTNYEDLKDIPIPPFNGSDSAYLDVASRIDVLGQMSFTGTVEGFTHDFVAHGKLRTGQGNLVLENLVMTRDSVADDYNWDGILSAEEFNIGAYLGVPEMGHITGTANMIGFGTYVPEIVASMNANFSAFEYNGYRYTNIVVTEGQLAKEVFDGVIDMHDPNVDLHYDGYVDFKDENDPILEFYAKIDTADFGALGFVDTSYGLIVSTEMDFDMHGSNIDNLDGTITLNNIDFVKFGNNYHLNTMVLTSSYARDSSRVLAFSSDFVNARMEGKFKVLEIGNAVTDVMSAYLPAYFPPAPVDKRKKTNSQYFTLTANFLRNTEAIQAFVPDLMIAPKTFVQAGLNQSTRSLNVNVLQCDSLFYKSYEIYNFQQARLDGTGGNATLKINLERVQSNDSTGFDNIAIVSSAGSNKMTTDLFWQNETEKANLGKLQAVTSFDSEKSLNVKITEGMFTFNDSTWQVDPQNEIRKDSSVITFRNIVFRSGSQYIFVKGRISENPQDVLMVHLDKFSLEALNFFVGSDGLKFDGAISGDVNLSNLYHTPKFDGDAELWGVKLNNEKLGDGTATAEYDLDLERIKLGLVFSNGIIDQQTGGKINNIILAGYYYPQRKGENLDLTMNLRQMPLGLIKPVLADYCSMVVGHVGGAVTIKGSFDKPLLNGDLDLSIKKVKVDYLGIELVHPAWQKMYVRENYFEFDNFKITDNWKDTAVINGSLFHDNFENFQFDMYFEFNHFMVLNTTEKDNEDYYGHVYATGFMDLFGYADKKITMNITATTTGVNRNGNFVSSDFNIPMSTASEAGDNDFIHFEKEGDTLVVQNEKDKKVFNDNGIELTLNLTATEDALVHVIFDETVGDELSARGNGDLTMHITPNGDFTMFGSYGVKRGDYMFTLKNVVYAPFELVEGGMLTWNGDPEDARIDADAIYLANASVEPFFPFDTTNAAYMQNYPVNVIMHLDGQLMNPGLSFDIELPTADPNIQETVRSYTQSELEMNRQVLSLMVLNSFMTPAEFRDGSEQNGAAGAGTTLLSNFVSGTLNNWLSQISENANVKFKYRPNDDMTIQELKLALGTQLLNNRLTFDVAGSLTNATQTQVQGGYNQYVDVNVEYKVTEDGKVRLRAFNRGNEQSAITQGANHTQGAGVFYREDFETFGELIKRYKDNWNKPANSKQKQEQQQEQQQAPIPDPPANDTLIN